MNRKRLEADFEPEEKKLIDQWLKEQRTESTKRTYLIGIMNFRLWYKKSLIEFLKLEPREMRSAALNFQDDMVNEKRPSNTIVAFLTALGSFVTWNGKTLMLKNKRVRTQIDLSSHVFSNGDLSRMFDVANVEQKAILSTFVSLGWESSSILSLDIELIRGLIERAKEEKQNFVYFMSQRNKTGALRLGVLNPLCLEWLDKWLHDERSQNLKTLFTYTTGEGINGLLRHLARDAHITKLGRVHSHLIRKWVMSGLSRAKLNEFQIKFLLGKTIPIEDMTYLQTLQQEIEQYYPEAYEKYLNIRPEKILQVIDVDMKRELDRLKEENEQLKNEHAEENTSLKTRLEKLESLLLGGSPQVARERIDEEYEIWKRKQQQQRKEET